VCFVTFVVKPNPERSEGKTSSYALHHEEHEAARRQIPGNAGEAISRGAAKPQG
jgi:hypothetical protein